MDGQGFPVLGAKKKTAKKSKKNSPRLLTKEVIKKQKKISVKKRKTAKIWLANFFSWQGRIFLKIFCLGILFVFIPDVLSLLVSFSKKLPH